MWLLKKSDSISFIPNKTEAPPQEKNENKTTVITTMKKPTTTKQQQEQQNKLSPAPCFYGRHYQAQYCLSDMYR